MRMTARLCHRLMAVPSASGCLASRAGGPVAACPFSRPPLPAQLGSVSARQGAWTCPRSGLLQDFVVGCQRAAQPVCAGAPRPGPPRACGWGGVSYGLACVSQDWAGGGDFAASYAAAGLPEQLGSGGQAPLW